MEPQLKPKTLPIERRALIGFLILLILYAVYGCAPKAHRANVPDSLPALGSSVERTTAHVESAERLNNAAKPLAGVVARPLMDQVSQEHGAAQAALTDTRRELKSANAQRDLLERDNQRLAGQVTQITSGWGYRLQLWVARAFWTIVALTAAHFIFGAAGLAVAGPSGALFARLGVILNPFAWFQSARDNLYFRKHGGGGAGAGP
jgi:hypothetical protein